MSLHGHDALWLLMSMQPLSTVNAIVVVKCIHWCTKAVAIADCTVLKVVLWFHLDTLFCLSFAAYAFATYDFATCNFFESLDLVLCLPSLLCSWLCTYSNFLLARPLHSFGLCDLQCSHFPLVVTSTPRMPGMGLVFPLGLLVLLWWLPGLWMVIIVRTYFLPLSARLVTMFLCSLLLINRRWCGCRCDGDW